MNKTQSHAHISGTKFRMLVHKNQYYCSVKKTQSDNFLSAEYCDIHADMSPRNEH